MAEGKAREGLGFSLFYGVVAWVLGGPHRLLKSMALNLFPKLWRGVFIGVPSYVIA